MNDNKLYTLGIDIGSTTVKIAVLGTDNEVLFSDYERHFANIQETLSDLLGRAIYKLGPIRVSPVVTGSGDSPWPPIFRCHLFRKLLQFLLPCRTMRRRLMLPLNWAGRMQKSFILKAEMWSSV